MSKIYLLPIAAALLIAPAPLARVQASPLMQHGLEAAVPDSIAEVVRGGGGGGRGGGGGYRGGAAVRSGGVAVRSGGVAVRTGRVGVRGGVYRAGAGVVGGRRWYGGRWWPYGVGSCWSPTPVGYVWVCG